ncbi:hypothetical protein Btru_054394 [Bulinus truncatus]|nr:hypothetical protein Btru_054394 [Bulinus truncatus]
MSSFEHFVSLGQSLGIEPKKLEKWAQDRLRQESSRLEQQRSQEMAQTQLKIRQLELEMALRDSQANSPNPPPTPQAIGDHSLANRIAHYKFQVFDEQKTIIDNFLTKFERDMKELEFPEPKWTYLLGKSFTSDIALKICLHQDNYQVAKEQLLRTYGQTEASFRKAFHQTALHKDDDPQTYFRQTRYCPRQVATVRQRQPIHDAMCTIDTSKPPTVTKGRVGNNGVDVLRDTGCTTVLVVDSLITDLIIGNDIKEIKDDTNRKQSKPNDILAKYGAML